MKNKHNRKLYTRFVVTYLVILSIPIIILGSYVYTSFFHYIEDTTGSTSAEALDKAQNVNETYYYQMQGLINQMYLSDTFAPFQFGQNAQRAVNLRQELQIMKQLNPFIGELLFYFRGDAYAYSSQSSYSLSALFSQAFVYDTVSESDMLDILNNSAAPAVIPAGVVSSKLGVSSSDTYVTYVFQLPSGKKTPYATVLFLVKQSLYDMTFEPDAAVPSDTYIFLGDQLVTRTGNAGTDLSDALVQIGDGQSPWRLASVDGKTFLVTEARGANSGFRYYNVALLSGVLAPLKQQQLYFILLNLALLGVCGFLVIYFVRMNYNPIKLISQAILTRTNPKSVEQPKEIGDILAGIDALYEANLTMSKQADYWLESRRSMLLIDILKGKYSHTDEIYTICSEQKIEVVRDCFNVMLLRYPPEQAQTVRDADLKLFCTGLSDQNRQVNMIELVSEQSVVFISFCDGVQYALEIQDKLLNFLTEKQLHCIVGVSADYRQLDQFAEAFREASRASLLKHLRPDTSAEMITQEMAMRLDLKEYPTQMLKKLDGALEDGNLPSVREIFNQISNYIDYRRISDSTVQLIVGDMKGMLFKGLIKLNLETNVLYGLFGKFFSPAGSNSWEETVEDLLDICAVLVRGKEEASGGADAALAKDILEYIQENYLNDSFSLAATAEHFHITPSKLTNVMKRARNISPSEYVSDIKIAKAKTLLAETNRSIADICAELNYSSVSSFVRKFKLATGLPPQAYRKQARQE